MTQAQPENWEEKKLKISKSLEHEDVMPRRSCGMVLKVAELIRQCSDEPISLADISYFLNSPEFASNLEKVPLIIFDKSVYVENLAECKAFIMSMVNNDTPKRIELRGNCYGKTVQEEIRKIYITTNLRVPAGDSNRKDDMLKHFYSDIHNSSITQEKLVSTIKTIAKCYRIPYIDTFKIILEYDWSQLEEIAHLNINGALDILSDPMEVKSEIYSVQQSGDLYYNMTRLTSLNVQDWKKLGSKHGVDGFSQTLDYYDNKETEIWIAFASIKKIDNPNYVFDESGGSSVEMFVTITTSTHSPFANPMGISRVQTVHKNISPELISYASKIIHEIHPEKEYMIHLPLPVMRNIMYKEFEKIGKLNSIHLGDNRTETSPYLLSCRPDSGYGFEISWGKQKEAIEKGDNFLPVYIDSETGIVTIKNRDGNILYEIGKEEQDGEFAWFFRPAYQLKVDHCSGVPLVSYDIDVLFGLKKFLGEEQHHVYFSKLRTPDIHYNEEHSVGVTGEYDATAAAGSCLDY